MRIAVWGAAVGLVCAVSGTANAQAHQSRGWIDVNIGGAAAAEKTFTMVAVTPLDQESVRASASHTLPAGAAFDFGGGAMITPVVGLGISFTGTAHEDIAQLSIQVPHPLYFNASASDTAPTDRALRRVEGGTNIQVMIVASATDRLQLRVFGGPTYFRVEQEAVDTIDYDQSFGLFTTVNNVDITTYESRKVDGSGWGFHLGADVATFFNRVAGIGAYARISRGSVEIENTLASGTITVKTGGVQFGGGVRLRF
jgi:hypothetical protein